LKSKQARQARCAESIESFDRQLGAQIHRTIRRGRFMTCRLCALLPLSPRPRKHCAASHRSSAR
jgi:hypothetical protein